MAADPTKHGANVSDALAWAATLEFVRDTPENQMISRKDAGEIAKVLRALAADFTNRGVTTSPGSPNNSSDTPLEGGHDDLQARHLRGGAL